jgi:hypothetical protein
LLDPRVDSQPGAQVEEALLPHTRREGRYCRAHHGQQDVLDVDYVNVVTSAERELSGQSRDDPVKCVLDDIILQLACKAGGEYVEDHLASGVRVQEALLNRNHPRREVADPAQHPKKCQCSCQKRAGTRR